MKLASIYALLSNAYLGQDTNRQVDELKSFAKDKGMMYTMKISIRIMFQGIAELIQE